MKKTFLCVAALIMIFTNSFSQRKLGQTVVTANSGISLMGTFASIGANSNGSNDVFRSGPVYVGHLDVGITKLLSIGGSASYQSFRYYYDRNTSAGGALRCKDVTTRLNYGGKVLFHFGKEEKENIDMYAGVRVGYYEWQLSTSNQDSTYTTSEFEKNQPWGLRVPLRARHDYHFSAQILYGFRYYFSKYVGMNFEVGIGGPALFTLGLNAKLF